MAINQKQMDEWFEPTVTSDAQEKAYESVRVAAKAFAEVVNGQVPDSEQKLQIIQQIRSVVLSAELAIRTQWPKSLFSVN